MEDLLDLLPRWLIAAVLGPFLLGIGLLALLVEPTETGMAFVFVLFVGGMMILVLLALGLTLSIRQSRGLEQQGGSGK
jgi:membrane-bound ClpP family serine protease